MSAIIYARQSDVTNDKRAGDSENTLSLEAQLTACRQHAAQRGWTITAEYSEQFSGLSDQRPAYRRMLTDLKSNHKAHQEGDPARITQLVVYKHARLSRDPNLLVPLVAMLRSQGVEVEPVRDQKIGTGPLDELMLYTLATFNKLQVQDSVAHAQDARQSLLDAGKLVCSGRPRYGYQYDTQTRTRRIDEATAPVVRQIFQWYCEGYSARAVRQKLLELGTPSPSGQPSWGLKSIRDIIKDPTRVRPCGSRRPGGQRGTTPAVAESSKLRRAGRSDQPPRPS